VSVEIVDESNRGAGTTQGAQQCPTRPRATPRKHAKHWAVAWTILLLTMCLAPARVIPDEQTFSIKKYIPWYDLVVHFTLFTGFALSWIRATESPWRWVVVAASGLLLAAGTEWAQGLPILERDSNLLDGLADGVGLAAGLAAAAVLGPLSTTIDPRHTE
jgi:hypothetical protein